MKAICDVCGKYSELENVCTNCGSEILSEVAVASLPLNNAWGWGTFKFDTLDVLSKEEALVYMRGKWSQLENFTQLHLVTSQLSRFEAGLQEITVLVRQDDFLSLQRDLLIKYRDVSTEFEPIGTFKSADDLNDLLRKASGK